ncbi:methionine--tRNA ligase [Candidatus Saccharibacteria bacterium]|nr:methionine--tRNA ligase [Candidatus Saccharibacteria bacterium]MCB9834642.1 methionine--tRNA ligase [Candidatus Nomurabacteria bacterium]
MKIIHTAIPYVNDKPHLGHVMDYVIADMISRYYREIKHEQVILTAGTDDHGQKIQRKAEQLGVTPDQLVDQFSPVFEDFCNKLNIQFDKFVATSKYPGHKEAAQKLWLAAGDDIYKAQYQGLYCVGCEDFYTEKELIDGKCPEHLVPPEPYSQDNYFFALSKYTERLKQAYKDQEIEIVPQFRENELLSLLDQGLRDISISRDKSQLSWGIEVPGDPDQVMYVWFDALTNYITAIDYHQSNNQPLPASDINVIGKGILRFHGALWPAMLLSAGLKLPKQIICHGYIYVEGQKMSKSVGNVVNPLDLLDKYGSDATRYFVLSQIRLGQDYDYRESKLVAVYNADLANKFGNLVQRLASLRSRIDNKFSASLSVDSELESELDVLISEGRLAVYIERVILEVVKLNLGLEEDKPWVLLKQDPDQARLVLDRAINRILLINKYLGVVIPEASQKVQAIFADGIRLGDPLFPRIEPIDG